MPLTMQHALQKHLRGDAISWCSNSQCFAASRTWAMHKHVTCAFNKDQVSLAGLLADAASLLYLYTAQSRESCDVRCNSIAYSESPST